MKQNKAFVAGLTGPAGSGKSYICKVFCELANTLVIDTDSIARQQMAVGGKSYKAVVAEFGRDILLESGEINRPKLASIVFNNPEKLKKLNELTHANVIKESAEIIRREAKNYELILLESAILVEAGCDRYCDEVWYVYTKRSERRERLIKSRNYSEERIKSVMKSQNTDRFFREHSDLVINNSENTDSIYLKNKLKNVLKKKRIACF